ncbi:MAG TPA: GNAT family N-acetyltransferase [Acidimicrobiia bacterium]|nr:GNAT family N-acetyltransferase [Acidimicrobiia bacterium]
MRPGWPRSTGRPSERSSCSGTIRPSGPATPADAGYLHRLAVCRPGTGQGGALLRWAEQHAAEHGKAFLRLDCVAGNTGLRGYYQRAGYAHVGDVTVGDYTQSRLEKRVDG